MKNKIYLRGFTTTLTVLGIFFSSIFTFFVSKEQNIKNVIKPTPIEKNILPSKIDFGIPINIKISSINVDSSFEYVGLTPSGEVDVPKNPSNVAWFNFSPQPGEIGNSIIVGHYGWKDNIPSVFDNLSKINIDDKIYIEDERGETSTFIVHKTKFYNLTEDTSDIFKSKDDKSHLILITCGGIWNKISKSYSKRFVVFADKETL